MNKYYRIDTELICKARSEDAAINKIKNLMEFEHCKNPVIRTIYEVKPVRTKAYIDRKRNKKVNAHIKFKIKILNEV